MEQEQPTENTSYTSSRGLIALVAFFIMVVGIGGWYVWKTMPAQAPEVATNGSVVPVEEQPATTTGGEKASETPKVDPIKAQMPSLTRAIPVSANPKTVSQIQEVVKMLTDNYAYLQAWLQLGLLRNAAGDREGAIEAWKFATILRPNSSTAFLNLGDLYGYYLHDNAKAEQYLLAGIKSEPKNTYTYYKTYEFYMDIEKDAVKARKVLEDGIAANPTTSQDLKTSLDNL